MAALDGGYEGFLEGWFVAPLTGEVSFLLPKDAVATLSWSGSNKTTPLTQLAAVTSSVAWVWPAWPADAGSGAIAAKASLTKGESYWLSLNCSKASSAATGCALGARIHAATAPTGLSMSGRKLAGRSEVRLAHAPPPTGLMSCARDGPGTSCDPASSTTAITAATLQQASCASITDRDTCCASYDTNGYPCIPAVTTFSANSYCLDSVTATQHYADQQAACPPRADAVGAARPRVTLAPQVECSSLTDRYVCSHSKDGRTAAAYVGQACIPARTTFQNANKCETATWAGAFDKTSMATGAEFGTAAYLSYQGLHHEVQQLTLAQGSPVRSVQRVIFEAIECDDPSTDCIGDRGGTVQLMHAGSLGSEVNVATGTAAQIAASFTAIADATYSGLSATVELKNNTHVVWNLAVLTPWDACGMQASLTLLDVRCNAKVVASVMRETAIEAPHPVGS